MPRIGKGFSAKQMEEKQIIKISAKALEAFLYQLNFAKNVGKGEITISFHNYDFDKITRTQDEIILRGNTENTVSLYNTAEEMSNPISFEQNV